MSSFITFGKRHLALVLCSLVLLFVASCTSRSSTTGPSGFSDESSSVQSKPALKVGYYSEANKASALLFAAIAESQLRYPIDVEQIVDTEELDEELNNVDFLIGPGPDSFATPAKIINTGLTEVGGLNIGAMKGWYVPAYMLDEFPGLINWQALLDPAVSAAFVDASSGSIELYLSGDPTEVDQEIIDLSNVSIDVKAGRPLETFRQDVMARTDETLPVLVLSSEPSLVRSELGLVRIDTPEPASCLEERICAYLPASRSKYVRSSLEGAAPKFYSLSQKFDLNEEEYSSLTASLNEGENLNGALNGWIDANPEVWSSWLS